MVSPQPSAQCADGGEEESRAPWPRQRGSVVSRHWTLQPTAADNFGWPDQHCPALPSSLQQLSVLMRAAALSVEMCAAE